MRAGSFGLTDICSNKRPVPHDLDLESIQSKNHPSYTLFIMFSKIYVFSLLNLFALAQPPPGPPDYSGDRIAPYPSLTSPSTANTLGTRLFGWQGCGGEGSAESQYIKDAYDDMNRIASLAETSSNIDWKGQAAKDYFGPSAGKNIVRDGTRKEITSMNCLSIQRIISNNRFFHSTWQLAFTKISQDIMKSVQQLYSTWWGVRPSLWIRVSFPSLIVTKVVLKKNFRSVAVEAMAKVILPMSAEMPL